MRVSVHFDRDTVVHRSRIGNLDRISFAVDQCISESRVIRAGSDNVIAMLGFNLTGQELRLCGEILSRVIKGGF